MEFVPVLDGDHDGEVLGTPEEAIRDFLKNANGPFWSYWVEYSTWDNCFSQA
jgi:hypothetical protein